MDETHDNILGLGLGATEYATKSFSPVGLSSRVRSVPAERERLQKKRHTELIAIDGPSSQQNTRSWRMGEAMLYLQPGEAHLPHASLLGLGKPQNGDV